MTWYLIEQVPSGQHIEQAQLDEMRLCCAFEVETLEGTGLVDMTVVVLAVKWAGEVVQRRRPELGLRRSDTEEQRPVVGRIGVVERVLVVIVVEC